MLTNIGAELIISNPGTPQQNGLAERNNRTLNNLARTMLIDSGVPKTLWMEAINFAVYVLNITTHCPEINKSAFELLYKRKPKLTNLHAFGSRCFLYNKDPTKGKWDPRSTEVKLVGYNNQVEGFRLWLPGTNIIRRSKDVIFAEPSPFVMPNDEADDSSQDGIGHSGPTNDHGDPGKADNPDSLTNVPRSLRDRERLKKPARYETDTIEVLLTEPFTYQEALSTPQRREWENAMSSELRSMADHKVWTLERLPTGHKAIGCRWVFKEKTDHLGNLTGFRARLVVQGYSQRAGIDYGELFSPVARFETIRTILSLSSSRKLRLKQFDIRTAFLYGELQEEVYMRQPLGFEDGTDRVCRLRKSLYGLKQAPRCFNKKLRETLLTLNLTQSTRDHCVFYRHDGEDSIILAIYVDDAIIAASSNEKIDHLLQRIQDSFEITISPLSYFLGIHIKIEANNNIILNQTKYINNVLNRFDMKECKGVSTPTDPGLYTNESTQETQKELPYRELLGSLMYLAICTRPDIAFIVGYLSRYLDTYSEHHWKSALRILRYLRETPQLGLMYSSDGNEKLEGFSDSDFAGDVSTRRSVSGLLFKLNGGPIIWGSQQQKAVALSTTEGEFVAASEAAKSAIWVKHLLQELSCEVLPNICIDNQGALKLIKNSLFHRRTKHISVRYHFIRELVENGEITISYIPTDQQETDLLTKPLGRVIHQRLLSLIGMHD